jgi:adenine-specific DNA glycosylase
MINKNSAEQKFKKKQDIRKKCCVVIVDGEKILLTKYSKLDNNYLFEFPKQDISNEEHEVSTVFLKMKEKYGIKAKTKDRFICNIQHSYENFDLMMYVFELQTSKEEINFSDELKNAEWFSINQIWDVPLAPPDVTLAQFLLECNE